MEKNAENRTAKKILFTSGKGGVGKSTLSTTFARVWRHEGKRVLMIDLDISLRTLDIMLGISDMVVYDWGDVLSENCEPEAAVINSGSLGLLAAPQGNFRISDADMAKLLSYYEKNYDYIILDCPAGVGDVLNSVLNVTDMAIVISTPDSVCVRNAAVAAERAVNQGVSARLIINRFNRSTVKNGRALNIDEVIDATSTQLIGIVPEDMGLSLSILNGELIDADSKSVRAVKRIIKRLNGEYVPLKI